MNPNNNSEKKEFAVIMSTLADEMGAKINKNMLKLKFEALIGYDLQEISMAVTWLIKNRVQTFPAMPRVKEILDAIDQVSGKALLDTTANLECDFVIGFLKRHGGTAPLPGSHSITNYLMTRVWPWFQWAATVKEKDLVWFRKDFISRFEQLEKDEVLKIMTKLEHKYPNQIGLDIKRIS